MRTLIVFLVGSFFLGCGGGGDGEEEVPVVVAAPEPEPAPTPIEVTQCGDINVSLEGAEEIVEAANEEGVEVDDVVDEPEIPEFNFGQPTPTAKGVVIAACGSTVVTDDSISDDDTVTIVTNPAAAERLIELIHAGEIHSIEVLR